METHCCEFYFGRLKSRRMKDDACWYSEEGVCVCRGGRGWGVAKDDAFCFFSERESCRSEGELSCGQRRAGARASRRSPENAGPVAGTPPLLRKGPHRGLPSLSAARRPLQGPWRTVATAHRDNQADRKSGGPPGVFSAYDCGPLRVEQLKELG